MFVSRSYERTRAGQSSPEVRPSSALVVACASFDLHVPTPKSTRCARFCTVLLLLLYSSSSVCNEAMASPSAGNFPPGFRSLELQPPNRPETDKARRGEELLRHLAALRARVGKKGNRMYNQIADLPDCPERYIFAAAPSLLLVVRCFRVSHMKRRSLSATPHWWVGSLRLSWLAPWLTAE